MCNFWDDLMFGNERRGRGNDVRGTQFICECREVRGSRDRNNNNNQNRNHCRCGCGGSNRRREFVCRCRER